MGLFSVEQAMGAIVATSTVYCFGLALYRLYLSPLAKFPGPKIAAVTHWYERYHQIVRDGKFIWEIERLHEKYGPIVRITPTERHIKDSEFFTSVYPGFASKTDKHPSMSAQTGTTTSTFSTNGHDLHRLRRKALDPFFSKSTVMKLEPRIASKVEILCGRLGEKAGTGEVVDFSIATGALAMDVISEYCYGNSMCTDFLNKPDFMAEWHQVIVAITESLAVRRGFPLITQLLESLPTSWLVKLNPSLKIVVEWQKHLHVEVERLIKDFGTIMEKEGMQTKTIFHSLLMNEELPDAEKTIPRLADEADLLLTAGGETAGRSIGYTVVYVLETPGVLQKLQDEMKQAMPDANKLPKWVDLEKLPYLTAVIQEGFRMMYSVTTRSPRLHHTPLIYKDWTIPPFTKIASTAYFVCVDPLIFADPFSFRPERWLGDDSKRLASHLHIFGKGTRSCVGMNLAYAELYLVLAALFRRFDLELFETTLDDVKFVRDTFLPSPERGRDGVRVKVKSVSRD